MRTLARMVSGHTARLALAAGLVWCTAAGAAAQAPGMQHTGPTWGMGRGGGALNDKVVPAPKVRSVEGSVLDGKGTAIKGAMVYLKNDRTEKVQTVTVDANGKFRFMQVLRTDDYKLWAQAAEKKSTEKSISSFDNTIEVQRDLKVE